MWGRERGRRKQEVTSCFPPPLLGDESAGTTSRLVGLKKAGASLPVQAKNVHIFPRKTVGKDGETSFLTHSLEAGGPRPAFSSWAPPCSMAEPLGHVLLFFRGVNGQGVRLGLGPVLSLGCGLVFLAVACAGASVLSLCILTGPLGDGQWG